MIKIFLRKLVAFLVDVKELDEKGIEGMMYAIISKCKIVMLDLFWKMDGKILNNWVITSKFPNFSKIYCNSNKIAITV